MMRSLLKRTVLFLLLIALLCACLPLPALAAETAGFALEVTAFSQNEHTAVRLWWDADAKTMRLFLPSQCDAALPVRFSGAKTVTVDGESLVDGQPTDAFSVGDHTLAYDGTSCPLQVMRSENLPAVFLDTASGSLGKIQADKSYKETGSLTVIADGKVSIDHAALKSVKGRGNSTWTADKKPYNIKFDKKTDVLGMGKAKKWSLLANHFDESLLRNTLAFRLAADFGLADTPECRMVDLYANGEYQGNYLITESVEIGETRVAIADLEDANEAANPDRDLEEAAQMSEKDADGQEIRRWADITAPENITGGYLLETEFADRFGAEVSGFVTENGQHIVLKSPEYAAREEVDYIAAFYAEMEEALYADNGFNKKGRRYLDYFDVDQLVKMYILAEYTFQRDAGLSSCYFYKDAGESVLHAGPAWDFDLSMGNTRFNAGLPFDVREAGNWWANAMFYYSCGAPTPTVFTLLYRHEDFRALVSEQWKTLSATVAADLALLPGMIGETLPSALMNAFRWGLLTGSTVKEKEASYRRAGERLKTFTAARAQALDKGFGPDSAMVYYHVNGGSGAVYNGAMLTVGDKVTLRETDHSVTPVTAPETKVFAGWNTLPDGSGTTYRPGEQMTVAGKTTDLYAQWQTDPAQAPGVPGADGVSYTVGDVDLDGSITAADARLTLRTAVRLENPQEAIRQLADADGDKAVTSADARIILRTSVRLEPPSSRTVLVPAALRSEAYGS